MAACSQQGSRQSGVGILRAETLPVDKGRWTAAHICTLEPRYHVLWIRRTLVITHVLALPTIFPILKSSGETKKHSVNESAYNEHWSRGRPLYPCPGQTSDALGSAGQTHQPAQRAQKQQQALQGQPERNFNSPDHDSGACGHGFVSGPQTAG